MENEQLEKIRTVNQGELLAIADATLDDPAAFKLKADAWEKEQGSRKAALEADTAELEALMADHRRLNTVGVAASQAASIKIKELRSEAARNPAADLQGLAEMAERERIKAAFITSTVRALVMELIPRQDVQVKRAEWQASVANTQVATHDLVMVMAEFIKLAAPLAEAMGTSGIEPPPRVRLFLDRAVKAWRAERGAQEQFVLANSALAEMERATQCAAV